MEENKRPVEKKKTTPNYLCRLSPGRPLRGKQPQSYDCRFTVNSLLIAATASVTLPSWRIWPVCWHQAGRTAHPTLAVPLGSLSGHQPLPDGVKGKGCCSGAGAGSSSGVEEKVHWLLRGLGKGGYCEAGGGPGGGSCPLGQVLDQEGPGMLGDLLMHPRSSPGDCLEGG